MEYEHKELSGQLRAVFDAATDGIIIIDSQGIMIEANPAVTELFYYNLAELIGRKVNMLMTGRDRKNHDKYIDRYQKTGEKRIIGKGREVVGRRKDGSTFPLRLAVSEVVVDGETYYTGILHDISEFRQAQERIKELNSHLQQMVEERTAELNDAVNQLLQTNKQLRQENEWREIIESKLRQREKQLEKALTRERELGELKTRFVSMASHEFRTPLATILSSASILAKYTETEQQIKRDKHIERIKSQVKIMNGVLSDFLSLSKLESGRIEPKYEHVNFSRLCDEIAGDMEVNLRQDQYIEHSEMVDDLQIHTDPRILKNIIYNLMSNAIKYSPEGSVIYCRAKSDGKHLRIEIQDEGMGIPEEDQKHLFTRFFRAKNAINIQGTGLGLNIVKRYLDILGGTIAFTSKEGKGTTFFVKLPVNRQDYEENSSDRR